jgi:hypothetical protein
MGGYRTRCLRQFKHIVWLEIEDANQTEGNIVQEVSSKKGQY